MHPPSVKWRQGAPGCTLEPARARATETLKLERKLTAEAWTPCGG